ncbi:MAG: hypothetical protein HYU41_09025 [Candidatus Rokubacteria bacterium]|nr:hypothetical protein [Candidatus Rokubacteria bacterium]
MRSLRVALAAAMVAGVLWMASLADAAPGDFRLITGTVVAPLEMSTEPVVVVVQGDDGVMHFAEFGAAESFPRVRAGERVQMLGREGFQAGHLLFAQVVRRDDPNGSDGAALPAVVASDSARSILESPDVVVGVVESLRGRSLAMTNRRGQRVNVDVSAIDADIRRDLKPGDQVTVFAPTRISGSPVASGILVDHTPPPSALPRQ